ncbi:Hypothetical protein NocV09_08400080 [Nannochloropsis oceanica]
MVGRKQEGPSLLNDSEASSRAYLASASVTSSTVPSSSSSSRPNHPLSIQSPGGSTFEVHVAPGPITTREEVDQTGVGPFAFHTPALKAGSSGGGGGKSYSNTTSNNNSKSSSSSSNRKALRKKYSRSNSGRLDGSALVSAASGSTSGKGRKKEKTLCESNCSNSSGNMDASGQRRAQEGIGMLGRSTRTVKRLWRPFGLVHNIVGDHEEMRRHPSLMHREPTARVTRFFLWRKWTIIVIILQLYVQVGVDIRNFSIFMSDPYESVCPCRNEVAAQKALEEDATRANKARLATRSALGVASILAAVQGSPATAAGYAAQAQLYDKDVGISVPSELSGAFVGKEELLKGLELSGINGGEGDVWSSVLFQADGSVLSPQQAFAQAVADGTLSPESTIKRLQGLQAAYMNDDGGDEGRRRLQEQQLLPSSSTTTPTITNTSDANGTVEEDVNTACDICDSVASMARTGMLPSCYKYHALPGFNNVIETAGNDGRVGLVAFRTVNSTTPISLVYRCNDTEVGTKNTTCFYDDKLLLKRGCLLGFYASEYVTIEMSTVLARLTYAPSLTMRWADCDPITHTQVRDKVCLLDGKMVSLGYCEAAGLVSPVVERQCCLGSEDIFDTVYNQDYNNLMIFFDVVSLIVSFSRLISMHLALYFIDSYKMSAIFVMWTWAVPFLGAFLKYSYPLNDFVSQLGREGAINFMQSLTGAEYVSNTVLTKAMAEALSRSGGYDPIVLYLMDLIDALRSYAVYGQAFVMVTIEFYYRFLYALMVLGELGPLAICVLPGFRSAAVVLKTLLPESATLGWMVSVGPMVYMPFLACVLIMFIQVFSDHWFTLAALFYSLSNLAMIVFYWRNSSIYMDPISFRKQLHRQDMIRNILLALSFAFSMVFMVESSQKETQGAASTMRTIGPAGFLSFIVRCISTFQLASVFSADVVLYMLRRLQRQARQDRLSNMEYERALKEFWILDDPKDQELEVHGDSIDISASASAAVAGMGRKTMKEMESSGGISMRSWNSVDGILSPGEGMIDGPGGIAKVVEVGEGGDGRGGLRNSSRRPPSVTFTSSSPTLLQTDSSCGSAVSSDKERTGTTPLRGRRGP